ncbi:hypothetical protein NDU88_005411 [Pleurodeles waltl]|uniref:Uncharacterized protein n=1 Tax=Pleurodeles waltl TaxID=8319 RepID=A0AAV7LX91_PLEWA|nr:hypothetical protein NDU88_005411 [Pleurodeles waltl]
MAPRFRLGYRSSSRRSMAPSAAPRPLSPGLSLFVLPKGRKAAASALQIPEVIGDWSTDLPLPSWERQSQYAPHPQAGLLFATARHRATLRQPSPQMKLIKTLCKSLKKALCIIRGMAAKKYKNKCNADIFAMAFLPIGDSGSPQVGYG